MAVTFTLTACPMGRSMGEVLQDIRSSFPELETETVYVELDAKRTNDFRVKNNPTLLFLSTSGKELYRLEGFHETEEVKVIIRDIPAQDASRVTCEENTPSAEHKIIYLIRNNEPVPVQIEYQNLTTVKAPRITAVQLLLQTRLPGYENPLSESSSNTACSFFRGNWRNIYSDGV